MVKNSRICGVIVLKPEFDEKHQLKVGKMLATFDSLQRPLLDDNPVKDLVFDAQLIYDVNLSLDNDVDIIKAEVFMEFSADIPDHGVLRTIALEKACMWHEFKVVEQLRDKSIVELRKVRARGVP